MQLQSHQALTPPHLPKIPMQKFLKGQDLRSKYFIFSYFHFQHPREESSKKPPPKLRKIHGLQLKKPKNARFDPRFSADCGDFDEVAFHRDYAFLDDYRQKDIKVRKILLLFVNLIIF